MKILHTADWHLGKRLDRFSRLEEQVAVLEEIIQIADNEQPDAVLIAGDLFDSFNPSTACLELFYHTLYRLSNGGKRAVIAIAGNHDSPSLIDAPLPLAQMCGIVLIGYPKATITPFVAEGFAISRSAPGFIEIMINDAPFPLRILHTAYANEQRLKEYFAQEKGASLQASLSAHWEEISQNYLQQEGLNVLLTHLYMNASTEELSEEPEGEKPLKIGNAELITTSAIPADIHYTALGHLHGFQNIGTDERPIVYASSPLQYSFSEAYQQKYVVLLECDAPSQGVRLTPIPLRKGKVLERQCFGTVPAAIAWLEQHPNTLVELTIETDDYLSLEDRTAIYKAHSSVVYLIPKRPAVKQNSSFEPSINLQDSTSALFKTYYESKHKQSPPEGLMQIFNELL